MSSEHTYPYRSSDGVERRRLRAVHDAVHMVFGKNVLAPVEDSSGEVFVDLGTGSGQVAR
jgi:hypothetical protein